MKKLHQPDSTDGVFFLFSRSKAVFRDDDLLSIVLTTISWLSMGLLGLGCRLRQLQVRRRLQPDRQGQSSD